MKNKKQKKFLLTIRKKKLKFWGTIRKEGLENLALTEHNEGKTSKKETMSNLLKVVNG